MLFPNHVYKCIINKVSVIYESLTYKNLNQIIIIFYFYLYQNITKGKYKAIISF
jgi:hypothetical protein